MESSQDIDASYRLLRDGIETLVQDSGHDIALSREEGYPLLVLETPSDAAGFAIVNGIPDTSFGNAYSTFQKLYRSRHEMWRKLNLSFVVCRPERGKEHDAFFSSLETDVYFCRKYVVFLTNDLGQLQKELLRLPFFPLPEGRKGGVVRPASAQTFLQTLGVNAKVARQIVVPREYSASRLAKDFVRAGESLPSLEADASTEGFQQGGPEQHTRVKSVTIEAFRAYKQKQAFDVDADVVVLYGPNGLGKTSFFDAIDYVCTGRIGRLCKHRMSASDFTAIARHLGAPMSAGSVSIELLRGEATVPLSRSLNDWGHANVGIDELNRADTLQFLSSAKWGEKRARIESLERLFRATHLFSQSTPELLVEFEEDSTIPFDLVSRMLALDDYAAALKKINGVLTELKKLVEQCTRDASDLDTSVAAAREKSKALQYTQQPEEAGNQLREITTALIRDLRSEAEIDIDREEATTESAREWRAMVESAVQSLADDATLAQRLAVDFARFDQNRVALRDVTSQLKLCESNLSQAESKTVQDRKRLQDLSKAIEAERLALKQTTQRESALAQLVNLQDQYNKADGALQHSKNADLEAASAIDSFAGQITSLMSKLEVHESSIVELKAQIQTTAGTCQRLETVRNGLQTWNNNRARVVELENVLSEEQKTIDSLDAEIKALTSRTTETNHQLVESEQAYTNLSTDQEELTSLLDQIEAFVATNICPTCGTEHGSKEILLERIHAQKMTRPAQVDALAKRCRELRAAVKGGQESLTLKEQEKQDKIKVRDRVTKELSATRQAVAEFNNQAAEAGLDVEDDLSNKLTAKFNKATETLQHQQRGLKEAETQLAEIRQQVNVLETKQKERIVARKKAALVTASLEQTITECRANAQSLNLSLEMEPEKVDPLIATTRERRVQSEQRVAELCEQREPLERMINASTAQVEELRATLKSLLVRQSELQDAVQRYEESAAQFLKADALSEDAVNKRRQLTQEHSARLEALRKRCLNLERSLDAAQRSAALSEIDDELRSLAKLRTAVDERAKQETAAKKWSERLKSALERQSSCAVADHVDSLGPLTTLIQQRLRTVYGFGDVTLVAKRGQIRVQVGWGDQQFKPANYFSDSQKQILMLSIFLAGRLTQTWSGFAPILLDDPVTHFDDLNAFGFVELIRGFVTTLPGKRQFFISTCEDRLFDLMRRKFSGITGGARFYRFSGIDGDGPVVESAS